MTVFETNHNFFNTQITSFLNADEDCIENELPKYVERKFQDFMDVKIQFFRALIQNPEQQFATITKKSHQSKAILRWDPKYQI